MSSPRHVDTLLLHGGQIPDSTTGSRVVPLYQTPGCTFRDTEHAADLFGLTEPGNIDTHLSGRLQPGGEA